MCDGTGISRSGCRLCSVTGLEVDCTWLDFSKAFDKVSHPHLLRKLSYPSTDQNTSYLFDSKASFFFSRKIGILKPPALTFVTTALRHAQSRKYPRLPFLLSSMSPWRRWRGQRLLVKFRFGTQSSAVSWFQLLRCFPLWFVTILDGNPLCALRCGL